MTVRKGSCTYIRVMAAVRGGGVALVAGALELDFWHSALFIVGGVLALTVSDELVGRDGER